MAQDELDKVYSKYKDKVNMTYTELLIWSKNPASKLASLDRSPIRRNLRLLRKPKYKWLSYDIDDANKTISYIARAKKIKRAKGYKRNELTPNMIAMRNWGYDVFKDKKIKGPKY